MNWMFLPLKRYAEFSGRSRPQEFWMFFVLQLIIYTVLTIITLVIAGGIAGLSSASSGGVDGAANAGAGLVGMIATFGIFALFFGLVYLVFFLPNLAVSSRRLHDQGRSGWWQLIYWVPWLFGVAVAIVNAGSPSSALAGISMIFSGLQLLGLLVLIVFYCLPGTPGPNEYGPDPLGGQRGMGNMGYQT